MCYPQLRWKAWINSIIQYSTEYVWTGLLVFHFPPVISVKTEPPFLWCKAASLKICIYFEALDKLYPKVLRIFAVNLCNAKTWFHLCCDSCSILHSPVLPSKHYTLYKHLRSQVQALCRHEWMSEMQMFFSFLVILLTYVYLMVVALFLTYTITLHYSCY